MLPMEERPPVARLAVKRALPLETVGVVAAGDVEADEFAAASTRRGKSASKTAVRAHG